MKKNFIHHFQITISRFCSPFWSNMMFQYDNKKQAASDFSSSSMLVAKECLNYCTVALISHTSKIMLKICQARLQQYVNHELPDVQAGFRKGRRAEIKFPTSVGSLKKQDSSRKTSTCALLTMWKPLTVWITTNCGKFWKRWEYQTTWPPSWEICMQAKKQQLELDLGQQTGSKSGKEYIKAVYCHPAHLTSMQKTSCESWAGWSTSYQ